MAVEKAGGGWPRKVAGGVVGWRVIRRTETNATHLRATVGGSEATRGGIRPGVEAVPSSQLKPVQ
ncbi:protein of unknown function [Methylocaldum szegediense]|uniref:Uncharacterized protein n=1 Tax=Methylocaldum szegediense TaxID=73780 RepID=A0ABN8X7N0_9GAMM|nr:protein of unknown function [Methylocaldum szegediense]